MGTRQFRSYVEILESRALLSHIGLGAATQTALNARGQSPALVGSIQGTESYVRQGIEISGTGTVAPLGDVTVTGLLGPGRDYYWNGKGTLRFWNADGSLTLSMKSHGLFRAISGEEYGEEIRTTVQVQSAKGTFAGVRVKGTVDFLDHEPPIHRGPVSDLPFTAQIDLNPTK